MKIITLGIFDFTHIFAKFDKSRIQKILVLIAPYQSAKEARINVASAINYFKDKFKFDYIFYCYGSSLMTMRKVNGEVIGLDLNEFASKIGTSDDGGHAEAATCKPASNPSFPKRKLSKINAYTFNDWIKYIALKIERDFRFNIIIAKKLEKGFYNK